METVVSLSLQECVIAYQETRKEMFLEQILKNLDETIRYYIYRTNYYDIPDLIGVAHDTLLKCLNSYSNNKRASFKTYYSRSLGNAIQNYFRDNAKHFGHFSLDAVRNTNEHSDDKKVTLDDSINSVLNELQVNDEYTNVELNLLLEQLKELNNNEFSVCKLIISSENVLKKLDIARELNLSPTAINDILKRLQKKFEKIYKSL